MKKLIFSAAALSMLFVSCSDDDDNDNTAETVATAAVLEGGAYAFCVDGLVDNITDNVVSEAGTGTNSTFIVTDTDGMILGRPAVVSGPDFDAAGVGTCYVWHLNYEGDPETFFEGVDNIEDLSGDFALSNNLEVNREDCAPSVVAATLVAGESAVDGEYTFFVNGIADNVTDLVVENAGVGESSQIVVTDESGLILGLPPVFEGPDFDAAGVGICYIRHVNYSGAIEGLEASANINDLEGDFKVSNIIVVNRVASNVVAATLAAGASAMGGEYTFSVDGIVDNVTDLVVEDAGAGESSQIVVTDESGLILGLPPVFEGPDFDAAGVGVCYISHVNYDGTVGGLEVSANIKDLVGDFKVSNIIVVNRIDESPSVIAATLVAGPSAIDGQYLFEVDGMADNVTDLIVEKAGAGESSQIVVTDESGLILGLPPVFERPDFDAAGVGVCYIRHVNYDGTIEGLEVSANINDLVGDFKVSNIIVVNRI